MSSVPQLSPYSSEFGLIEYIMRLQLDAPRFKIAELYEIAESNQVSEFESFIDHMSNTNIVDVFIDVKQLSQATTDIIRKGIRIRPQEGLKINVGSIKLEPGLTSYQYIHCIVALGRVIDFQDRNTQVADETYQTGQISEEYAQNYDSVRVSGGGEFVIFRQEQIKSVHIVRFLGGENLSKSKKEVHICSNCSKPNATIWCVQDQVKLCKRCDENLHNANKLLKNHKRGPLNDASFYPVSCPHHKQEQMQYYCPKCHMSMCMECKINGHHSKGEFQNHPIIPIAKAYNEAIESLGKPTDALTQRTNKLHADIEKVEEHMKNLLESTSATEAEITRIANEAIEELHKMAFSKATLMKSMKHEIQRKIDEIELIESHLEIHKENSDPVTFLTTYTHRNELIDEVKENTDLPRVPSEIDQYTVFGSLRVGKINECDESDGRFTDTYAEEEEDAQEREEVPRGNPIIKRESYEPEGLDFETIMKPIERVPHFPKLSKIAAKKELKYKSRKMRLSFQPFAESKILTDPELQRILYMCLPFKELSETHLMCATYRDGRSIAKMHKIVDGRGVSILLVSANSQIFGGFAATKWNSDGVPFGNPKSSFLFSISKDAFIPHRNNTGDCCPLFAENSTFTFGRYDLCLQGNFDKCSSQLENSYGIGLEYGSQQASTFMAGNKEFTADEVEIWGFFAADN